MYRALYDELVCRTNFTCIKCILYTLSVGATHVISCRTGKIWRIHL